MTIIGNLLLFICTILFFINTATFTKAPPQNDGAVGYYWTLIILNGIFIIAMILATLIIGYKGGLDWVSPKRSSRVLFVTIGLLSALATMALAGLLKYEAGPVPGLIRIYSSFVPILIPLVLIITGFILLNSNFRYSVPMAVYQWPLVLIFIIGVTGTASGVVGFLSDSAKNKTARINDIRQQDDDNHQRMLADIDSCDVMKNMVFILVHSDANQYPDIREKSVAKIKTNPRWQQELIRLIQTDWAPEPFNFLASNDVDDPQLFLEPVREGVLIQARLIRETIRKASHPSHFYEGQFRWEVERVLRTVDRFKNKGVDYLPAVKELRAAFNEPSGFEKPKWGAVEMVDEWLKENS
jgi:hypothetical protein